MKVPIVLGQAIDAVRRSAEVLRHLPPVLVEGCFAGANTCFGIPQFLLRGVKQDAQHPASRGPCHKTADGREPES